LDLNRRIFVSKGLGGIDKTVGMVWAVAGPGGIDEWNVGPEYGLSMHGFSAWAFTIT
jgi:hypothetical protein